MHKSTIPWHVFLDALAVQGPAINRWLERWRFTDSGVLLLEPEQPAGRFFHAGHSNDHG